MGKVVILALIFRYHKFKLLIILITLIVLFNTLLYTHIYTVFDVIPDHDIVKHLVIHNATPDEQSCKHIVANSTLLDPVTDVPPDPSSWVKNLNLNDGGEWHPLHCVARYFVAIIIPYRNREEHLKVFLYNIHPFLQQQNIHYKIFVVEQDDKNAFNRGKLLNVGFVEALKDKPFPCFVFHDVDLIPQNLNNIYACTKSPRHVASSIDKYRYKVPYDRNFGGVTSILTQQFRSVNGFSNKFFGWGGEDDDFFFRVRHFGYALLRFSQQTSRYKSLTHKPAKPSADRMQKLNAGYGAYESDGLNSLHYHVKATVDTPTHVRIVVEL